MTTFASAPNLAVGLLFQSLFFFFMIRFSEILLLNHDPHFKNVFIVVFISILAPPPSAPLKFPLTESCLGLQ